MAYRLKPGGSVKQQLSRIVRKEFDRAADELRGAARVTAVRETRKHVKKIRAVLHLLQPALGSDYRIHNSRLRAIAHQLSALRDADAAIESMKVVRTHFPRLVTSAIFEAVSHGLSAGKRGATSRLQPNRRLPRVLRELRRSAKTMPRRVRRGADVEAIHAGVVRGYRRARQAMRSVQTSPNDLGFHRWRRRVKDHWYHLRLLEALHPAARNRDRQLKRLERLLGDDHNLVLLRATMVDAPSKFGGERTTAIVLGCIKKYQATLRRRAGKLGSRLFARKPNVFGKSLKAWVRQAQ